MTEYLNIYVLGEPMVSIPIKTPRQQEVFASVSAGKHDGDTFVEKTHNPIITLGEKEL